jgi:hypothetical protein
MKEDASAATDALEPRQTKITARLNAQGAMLDELQVVVMTLGLDATRADARRAVLDDNVLQRPSLGSRVDVFEKLSVRYFRSDAPRAVARLVQALHAGDPMQSGHFAYTMLLWNDALVFLLGCEWLSPKLDGPPFSAETHDVIRELERLSVQNPEISKWSPGTRRKVATHYLGLLRDCGYASGSARKLIRRPFISPDVVLFGAQLVIGGGEPAARVPEHPLFRAMGLSVEDVVGALSELRRQGRVEFAIQGDTVHLAIREAEDHHEHSIRKA